MPGPALRIRANLRMRRAPAFPALVPPPDPRDLAGAPLEGDLDLIRRSLLGHRRRLWLRRIVRRGWLAGATILAAEAALLLAARAVPIELLGSLVVAVAMAGLAGFLVAAIRCRPSLGETALAVDREARLGDRVASALALAAWTSGAEDASSAASLSARPADAVDFVRRQRADAGRALAVVSGALFRPRLATRPAAVALVAALLIVPLAVLPNGQDQAIAQARATRDEAQRQANRIEQVARDLESKGPKPDDPRSHLAADLRDLAAQLRGHPGDLNANLARLGSVEASVHSQLDPGNEQRASSLTSLNRSLSRAASGRAEANKDGDPKVTADDLKNLGSR
ncbi:MAG TPA: hypothetical protein VGO64_02425, partial [Candidatus Limnocylindrales bacterium]|nr:hypothetical protein [Candidatus Limnocylindrales bacterium]